MEVNMSNYSKNYSESNFWDKVKSVGRSVPFLRDVIAMYYCLKDPKTPVWVKLVIISSIGYFISPIDTVPDILPVVGYGDDATVITVALGSVSAYVTEKHYKKADKLLN